MAERNRPFEPIIGVLLACGHRAANLCWHRGSVFGLCPISDGYQPPEGGEDA